MRIKQFYCFIILALMAILPYTSFCLAAQPELPVDIEWLTNDTDPVFASPEAVKGGTMRGAITNFPLTFRVVGPDSNSGLSSLISANQYGLIGIHPNTLNIIPELATHWAFGKDKKTMYFKLNKNARWSDGHPVTADDYVYTLEFHRSPHIVAPWYNDYYTKEIDKVIVYDDHTLAVVATKAQPDLHMRVSLAPTPRHYYGVLDKDFIRKYNYRFVPNTGPYLISGFKKGKSITFKRKKEWWGKDLKYFKHRFNVDKVIYTVVRDYNLQWEHFKKAKIDAFPVTLPKYWHVKSNTPVVENGYVHKIWFFNDTPQSSWGIYLNTDKEIFKDVNVRYAFAHAMNVQKVIDTVLRNDYFRLESGYVGYGEYSNNTIRARRFELEKVKAYMTKSGWKRGRDGIWEKSGKRLSVELSYNTDEYTSRLVLLKEEAKKAGIELRLQILDSSTNYKKVMEKKHEAVYMGWTTSLRPRFWEHYHSINSHKPQTNNITNTDDPELDKLIDAYRGALDENERIRLAKVLQEKVHAYGAYVPTFMIPYVRHAYWRWWRLPDVPGTKLSDNLFAVFDSTTGGLFWFDKSLYDETKAAMKKKKKFSPVTIVDKTYKIEGLDDK